MDLFDDRHFKLTQKLLSFVGVWYSQPYKKRVVRYFLIGLMFLYSLPAQLCQFFSSELDLQTTIFILQIFITAVCFAAAYCNGIQHFVLIRKVCHYVKQDLQRLKDNAERKIIEKHAAESRMFIFICGSIFCLFLCLFIVPSVVHKIQSSGVTSSTDRFPIVSCLDYFIDRDKYYYPILISQIAMLITGTIAAISCYSLHFSVIQHICARLSIIKYKIRQPHIHQNHNRSALAKPTDLSHWIIDIIQHLTRTTEFMNIVNTAGEKCSLLQMSLGFLLVVIDFVCLLRMPLFLQHKESNEQMIALVVFILGTLLPIYVTCYVGQKLMDYSADVHREVCLIPIHEISLKTQKLLLVTLIMSAKPFTISIGKVFVASHAFFSELFQTSISFAMVLHSLKRYG